jgi:hypothetical protein
MKSLTNSHLLDWNGALAMALNSAKDNMKDDVYFLNFLSKNGLDSSFS